jgi:hypothetical protein
LVIGGLDNTRSNCVGITNNIALLGVLAVTVLFPLGNHAVDDFSFSENTFTIIAAGQIGILLVALDVHAGRAALDTANRCSSDGARLLGGAPAAAAGGGAGAAGRLGHANGLQVSVHSNSNAFSKSSEMTSAQHGRDTHTRHKHQHQQRQRG